MTRWSSYRTRIPFSLAVLAWAGFSPLVAMPPKRDKKATSAPSQAPMEPSQAQLQAALAALFSAAGASGTLAEVMQGVGNAVSTGSLVVESPGPLAQHTCPACGLHFAHQQAHALVSCPACHAELVTSTVGDGNEAPAQSGPEAEP